MTEVADALDRLPRGIRRKLDAFSQHVDAVDVALLSLYVAHPFAPDHDRSVATAELVAIETGREAAVAEARRIARDYIDRRYASDLLRPGRMKTTWSIPASGLERADLAASFEQAITAIMLSDALDEGDLDELLGPWASLATES